jgi:hypothetical protein
LAAGAAAALLGLLLSLAPVQVHAQIQAQAGPGEVGTESWGRALGFIGCALAIVAASDGIGVAFAVVACGRALMTELEG